MDMERHIRPRLRDRVAEGAREIRDERRVCRVGLDPLDEERRHHIPVAEHDDVIADAGHIGR